MRREISFRGNWTMAKAESEEQVLWEKVEAEQALRRHEYYRSCRGECGAASAGDTPQIRAIGKTSDW